MSKTLLKAAREALDSQEFQRALRCCQQVLESEPENYHAHIFSGLAQCKMAAFSDCEETFKKATELQPDALLAYQGLVSLYKTWENPEKLGLVLERTKELYWKARDAPKLYDALLKLAELYASTNERQKEILVLQKQTSTSEYYELVKELITLSQKEIWERIARLWEDEFAMTVEQKLREQRFKIPSQGAPVTRETIERDFLMNSEIAEALEHLLDLQDDKKESVETRARLVDILYKKLKFAGVKEKETIFRRCQKYAVHIVQEQGDPSPPNAYLVAFDLNDWTIEDYPVDLVAHLALQYPVSLLGHCCSILANEGRRDIPKELHVSQGDFFYFPLQVAAYAALESGNLEDVVNLGSKALQYLRMAKEAYTVPTEMRLIEMELFMARAHQKLQNNADALSYYRSVLSKDDTNLDALEGLGEMLLSLNNISEAKSCVEKILKLQPENDKALSDLGWIYLKQKEFKQAIQNIERALAIKDNYFHTYRLGRAFWEQGTDLKRAFQLLLQAAKKNPNFSMTFCYLGHYYNQSDNAKVRAEKCFQKSIELDVGNSEATKALIQLMLEKRNDLAAKQLLSNYCEANPQNSWAHKRLGVILMNMDKIRDAIDHFHMSLRSNDKDPIVWECLGECFYRDGKTVAALKTLKRASDLTDEPNSSCRYLTGHIKMASGLFSEAVDSFDEVLKIQPNHLPSLRDKAQSYFFWTKELFNQGSFEACYDVLERSITSTIEAIGKQGESHLLHKVLGDLSIFALQTCVERTHDKIPQLFRTYVASSFSSQLANDLPYFEVSSKMSLESVKDDASAIFLNGARHAFLRALSLVSGGDKTLLSAYYNDVAVAFFKAYLISGDASLRDLALKLGKMNISIASAWDLTWNALGVFLSDSDPIRSQHSFIKSIQLEKTATSWSNLGILFSLYQDFELAGEAFLQAQLIDIENPLSWVCKAIMSKTAGLPKIEDLTDQALQLSQGSCMELNHVYLSILLRQDKVVHEDLLCPGGVSLYSRIMHCRLASPMTVNLLGLILEKTERYRESIDAFSRALELIQKEGSDPSLVLANLARVTCSLRNFPDSVCLHAKLHQVYHGDLFTYTSQGLSLYFSGRIEEALPCFERALSYGADYPQFNGEMHLLLGKVICAMQIPDNVKLAKEQLFQSFESITANPQDREALFALLASGLIEQDFSLTESAALEIRGLDRRDSAKDLFEVTQYLVHYDLVVGRFSRCKTQISKAIHCQPWNAKLWSLYSSMLVHVQSITTTMPEPTGFPDAEAILTVCRTAETLQRSTSTTSSTTSPQLSLGYTGREMALAFLAKGNADPHSIERRHARSAALKAIRMNPYSFSNWSSLGLLELSGYVVGDESKALGLNCIVKSLQLLAQSNDESVTVSQEEFVSQVSREIQSRIFSQMNDSESGVYRQGKFAELIRLKKAALAESLSMTRLEELAYYYESSYQFEDSSYCLRKCAASALHVNHKLAALTRLARLNLKAKLFQQFSDVISELNSLDSNWELTKLLQAAVQVTNNNKAKVRKILETASEQCKQEWRPFLDLDGA